MENQKENSHWKSVGIEGYIVRKGCRYEMMKVFTVSHGRFSWATRRQPRKISSVANNRRADQDGPSVGSKWPIPPSFDSPNPHGLGNMITRRNGGSSRKKDMEEFQISRSMENGEKRVSTLFSPF